MMTVAVFAGNAAKDIAKEILKSKDLYNKNIAIIDFTDLNGRTNMECKYLTERVVTEIASSKKINVIERKQLAKILSEQSLSMEGLTEQSNMQQIGKILNVEAILTGSLVKVNNENEINARLINAKNGEIITAINTKEDSTFKEQPKKEAPEVNLIGVDQATIEQKNKVYMDNLYVNNVNLYNRMFKAEIQINQLSKKEPRVFLTVTEPKNEQTLEKLRINRPKFYNRVMENRDAWWLVRTNPFLREKYIRLRNKMLKNIQ